MIRTKVKLYLKDNDGNKETLVTWVNLPEEEAHTHYIGKWLNMGESADKMMKCHKVETLKRQEAKEKNGVSPAIL